MSILSSVLCVSHQRVVSCFIFVLYLVDVLVVGGSGEVVWRGRHPAGVVPVHV